MNTVEMHESDIPETWELLAEVDDSISYDVDMTRIYRNGDAFVLATARGCSCWSGEWEVEHFPTLDALGASVAVTGDDRTYNPSPLSADQLLTEARAKLTAAG